MILRYEFSTLRNGINILVFQHPTMSYHIYRGDTEIHPTKFYKFNLNYDAFLCIFLEISLKYNQIDSLIYRQNICWRYPNTRRENRGVPIPANYGQYAAVTNCTFRQKSLRYFFFKIKISSGISSAEDRKRAVYGESHNP